LLCEPRRDRRTRHTVLFIRRGNRWRRSSRRLFHHDFNRHRGNRGRLGPLLEEPDRCSGPDYFSLCRYSEEKEKAEAYIAAQSLLSAPYARGFLAVRTGVITQPTR